MSGYLSERSKAWQIAMAIIQARQLAKETAKPIILPEIRIPEVRIPEVRIPEVTIKKAPKRVTKTFGPVEKRTVKYERLVESFQPGGLSELLVISPTDNFGVTLIRDGQTILDKSFTELREPTQYMTKIEARQIEENGVYLGKYLLHVSEFNWSKEGMAILTCPEPVTFDYLFASYNEWVV